MPRKFEANTETTITCYLSIKLMALYDFMTSEQYNCCCTTEQSERETVKMLQVTFSGICTFAEKQNNNSYKIFHRVWHGVPSVTMRVAYPNGQSRFHNAAVIKNNYTLTQRAFSSLYSPKLFVEEFIFRSLSCVTFL